MLSILIPTYNYDITDLINRLATQLQNIDTPYEIIAADDCSTDVTILEKNKNILDNYNYGKFIPLTENIGRSAIRNFLSQEAKYDHLLFLDADVIPKNNDFIEKYIMLLKSDYEIIYGGIVYQENKPQKNQLLRWVYGNARESVNVENRKKAPYINFLTLNFLIKKEVSKKLQFNEEIPNLRCEDTLFSLEAKNKGIKIEHIDNVIIHNGLETSEVFLEKSLESIAIRVDFVKNNILEYEYTKLTKMAVCLQKMKISFLMIFFFKTTRRFFEKNFLSSNPSMFYFDLYRLGYYFYYQKNKTLFNIN